MSRLAAQVRAAVAPLRVKLARARCLVQRDYVLGRFACLGRDVYAQLRSRLPVINTQKGRVDCLVDYLAKRNLRPDARDIAPHLARADIFPLLVEQEIFSLGWLPPPRLILIDSFSELTDQKFVRRRDGSFFCANFTDVSQRHGFGESYACDGLLPAPEFKAAYLRFFSKLRGLFPAAPIVFLHFPTKLDQRVKFKERGIAILQSIDEIGATLTGFHSIVVDDSRVNWPRRPDGESFPYHFHDDVYVEMAEKIKSTGLL